MIIVSFKQYFFEFDASLSLKSSGIAFSSSIIEAIAVLKENLVSKSLVTFFSVVCVFLLKSSSSFEKLSGVLMSS